MITQAVITDMSGLYEGRTGRQSMRQLADFFRHATDHTASRPDFWSFYAHLQDVQGDAPGALESRFKMCRAIQGRLWEENDPEVFAARVDEFLEGLQAIDEALDEDACKEVAKAQAQPFAYLCRDVTQRLQTKLEATVQEPSWKPALPVIEALASKAAQRAPA